MAHRSERTGRDCNRVHAPEVEAQRFCATGAKILQAEPAKEVFVKPET